MRTSDLIWSIVQDYTDHVFFVPGGGAMHLVDSLANYPRITPVSMLHEQGAAYAAMMYGRYTNRLGVCLVTSGPGGTNAVSGVAAAWMDSHPMLVISGQVKTKDMIGDTGIRTRGSQEIDIISIVKPITKHALVANNPATVMVELKAFIALAMSKRKGPVWLDIPLDIQAVEV